jgi:ligand-binding sensor protein
MGNRELVSAMNREIWKSTLSTLNKAFQLNSLAIELDGSLMFEPDYGNTYCPLIAKRSEDGRRTCTMDHSDAIEQARSTKEKMILPCESGLMRLILPIRDRGILLGCAGGCGAVIDMEDVPVKEITETAIRLGLDPDKLVKEARDTVVKLTSKTIGTYFRLLEQRLKTRLAWR